MYDVALEVNSVLSTPVKISGFSSGYCVVVVAFYTYGVFSSEGFDALIWTWPIAYDVT